MTLFAKGVAGVGLAALLALLLVSRGAGQTPAWTSLGPPVPNLTAPTNFVDNGRVAAIAVDQSDQRRWLIGYGNSGVWETRDSGNSFRAHSDGWPAMNIGAIAFAPRDPQTTYVGTGELGNQTMTHVGIGIVKSTNGGET